MHENSVPMYKIIICSVWCEHYFYLSFKGLHINICNYGWTDYRLDYEMDVLSNFIFLTASSPVVQGPVCRCRDNLQYECKINK